MYYFFAAKKIDRTIVKRIKNYTLLLDFYRRVFDNIGQRVSS